LEIIEKLINKGVTVDYSDPHVPVLPKVRKHDLKMESIKLTPEAVKKYDCVIVSTDHDSFDYDMIHANAQLIVDSRGKYQSNGKVVKA
jgi:UDP-N-acetyl-D-glucosamine dehydrogenase